MSLWWAIGTVIAASALAIVALPVIRHFSPHGGHFGDTSRAAGIFSILTTSFAVLFAFIVFLSFTAYDKTRTGAETEANVLHLDLPTLCDDSGQATPPRSGG